MTSLIQRHLGKRFLDGPEDGPETDLDASVDLGCFGYLRGARERAVTVELRAKTGAIRAVPYGLMEALDYEPSEGIVLRVAGRTIRIRGRNLNAEARPGLTLFSGMCRHRVPWVQETSRAGLLKAADATPLIEAIEW